MKPFHHTLLLIDGRKMDYPARGEYGMNVVLRARLPIQGKADRCPDLFLHSG